MNTSGISYAGASRMSAIAAVFTLAVASCATAPQSPTGAAEVRSKLTALQSDQSLAAQVPVELREAEAAVLAAEAPVGKDIALGEHRVYIADRTVEIAMARAATRYAEEQRADLSQARDDARLAARTREADKARRESTMAKDATEAARASAASNAADAAAKARELQRQIDVLKAEATDRGLVLTLGDVLFATGRSDLKSDGNNTLDKLVAFLNEYPDRSVVIEGHTDDVGSLEMNQVLSQLRADSVKSYLMQKGIRSQRLSASGMGETRPVANNQSQSGRQQNRRVEVIIKNVEAIPAATLN